MTIGLLGAVGAALLYGVGTVLQVLGLRRALASTARTRWSRVWAARLYAAGLGLDVLGFLASVAALRRLPLFLVESAVASSVAVTAVLAVAFLGARLQRTEWLALTAVGVGLVALAASAEQGSAVAPSRAGTAYLLAGVVGVGALLLVAARRSQPSAAPLLAATAGLGFGGAGVSARVLAVPSPWWQLVGRPVLWCLLAYAVVAAVAYGFALQRGSVTTTAAITFTVETVVPTAVGLAWLGDGVRTGWVAMACLGFALTLGGCLRLARHSVGEAQASGGTAATLGGSLP